MLNRLCCGLLLVAPCQDTQFNLACTGSFESSDSVPCFMKVSIWPEARRSMHNYVKRPGNRRSDERKIQQKASALPAVLGPDLVRESGVREKQREQKVVHCRYILPDANAAKVLIQSLERIAISSKLDSTCTHRPLSSSFLWPIFRILSSNPTKELLRGLWVEGTTEAQYGQYVLMCGLPAAFMSPTHHQ